ncbi:TMM79 protein, partial [Psilopogon haemacephalus]|nr:TMM79 protein [Psilopogon haemacephalus]
CPCLLYGAFVFLPFDAPLLPTLAARLVYALRCATFATVPIVLGEPAETPSDPPLNPPQPGTAARGAVPGVSSAAAAAGSWRLPRLLRSLLGQPLGTSWATSGLVSWLSYAFGRSFRVFGFSLTFLPLLAMLIWNLYSMLVLEPHQLLA